MRGMDINEYVKRDKEISDGLQSLLDDMYAAIDEKAPKDVCAPLTKAGKTKLAQYETFLSELQGAQREGAERQYASFIEELKKFLVQLAEIA